VCGEGTGVRLSFEELAEGLNAGDWGTELINIAVPDVVSNSKSGDLEVPLREKLRSWFGC
jgi:hypothetical protein